MHEDELVKAAQRGDSAAFDALVTRYQSRIYRLMVRVCHHPDDADEVAAETFERAYKNLQQFEGRSSFVSWLGRIGTHLCLRRRQKPHHETVPLGDDLEIPDFATPEQQAIRAEVKRIVRGAVNALPESERRVLTLRDMEGLSGEETAMQLGISLAAMKSRLHRARNLLRQKLNEDFGME